jgi:hypothetical protein
MATPSRQSLSQGQLRRSSVGSRAAEGFRPAWSLALRALESFFPEGCIPPTVGTWSWQRIGELFSRRSASPLNKKRLIALLSFSKNHAKHQDDGRNVRIDIDWQSEAEYMIFRAMLNHYNAFDCWPASKPLRIWMGNIWPDDVA